VYVAKGSKLVSLIGPGDRVAGVTIDDVPTVVPADRAVAFVGVTAGTARIFVARGRRVVHLSSLTSDPQNGSVSHSPYDLRFDGRRVPFRDAGTVYEAQEESAVAVLAPGAATSAGTLDAATDDDPQAFALADGELVVSSRLFGGDASEALLAVDLG